MKNLKIAVLLVLAISVVFSLAGCEMIEGTMGSIEGAIDGVIDNVTDLIPGLGGNDEHVHTFVDATCTAPKTCSECGETEGEALGHTIVTDEAVAPTCTESGLTAGEHCSVCEEVITAQTVVEAKGHDYASVKTEPTCTEVGYTTYTCACGDSYTADEVAALGHDYEAVTTAPTCTEDGYTTYTCACGDSTVVVDAPATGHDYEAVTTAPTCTTDGYTTYTCSCGDSYVADEVKAGHNHNENGICSGCGDQIAVNPVVGKGYIFGMYQGNLNDVYYLKGGMAQTYYLDTTTDASKAIYVYLEEAEGGYHLYFFDNGVKTYINTVVSGTHVNGVYSTTNPTVYTIDEEHHTLLTKVNGEDYWFGTRNDKTYTTVGPCKVSYGGFYCEFYFAHEHDYVKGETVAPTCEEGGYTPYTCSCGASYKTDELDALGHSFGEWTEVKPEAGVSICEWVPMQIRSCDCGAIETQATGEAPGHSYSEGVCGVCGKEDPDYVKPDAPVVPEGGQADLDAIVLSSSKPNGDSSYTGTYTSPNGWTSTNSAIQAGGATNMNPQFTVIGPDNTHKAVCLNGKTSAPGKLTSPTLTTGISKLTVNYTKIFSDTELSVTVTITDAAGNKYTHVIAQTLPSDEKYVVYTDVWTLDTPIVGEFTIEIVNNCPSALDKNKDRFTILDVIWEGAAEAHTHEYTSTTTATCTAAGTTTYTCSCGDTYTEETEKLGHVDANLDVSCDREGCTGKVAPAADSVLSNFTANNLGSKLSTSCSYYIVGTVAEVLDARNGIFLLDDGTGELFYIRLPKNADNVVHSSWEIKLVLGDKIQVYGNIAKFSSPEAPNGQYWPSMQSGIVTVLEQHPHVYTAKEADCFNPAYCECGKASSEGPNAHVDAEANGLCDNCGFKMGSKVDFIKTHFNDVKETSNYDSVNGTALWESEEFSILVSKGTSTFNSNGTNHFRLQKGNNLTITAKNGNKIVGIVFTVTTSSYTDELEAILTAAGIEYTLNGLELTVEVDSLDSFVLENTASKIGRIATVAVIYTAAPAQEQN